MAREFTTGLSNAQIERLSILAEECGEVVQAVSKILRHGFDSSYPDGAPTNRTKLENELGDVLSAMTRLYLNDISWEKIILASWRKDENAKKYLHFQEI